MSDPSVAGTEDWSVACCHDKECDIPSQVMQELFAKAAHNERLMFDWKCQRRRSPTPEREVENVETKEEMDQEDSSEQRVLPVAFDFNSEPSSELNTITPRRLPANTKTPRSQQRRVARLDKIMDDMMRHRKLDEEAALSERTSQQQQQQQQQ